MALRTVRSQIKGDLLILGDRLAVQKILPPDMTKDGFFLPNKFQTGLARGKITHIGSGVETGHKFKIGEVVYFPVQLSYVKINLNGTDILLVPMQQVEGVER